MNLFLRIVFLTGVIAAGLTSCQLTDHLSPEIPVITPIQSASILSPTTPSPSGYAYAVQTGVQYFLLDNKGQFWQYEPVSRSFTEKASPTLPDFDRGNFSAVDLFTFSSDDKAYLGGQSVFGTPGLSQGFPAFFYIYDSVKNTWTAAEPCPGSGKTSDRGRVSFFANGKGYVCFFHNPRNSDGSINYDDYVARCYEYDPAKAQWSLRFEKPIVLPESLTFFRSSQAATLNGKAYWAINAFPKSIQEPTSNDAYACIFELDPQTDQLTLKLTTKPFREGRGSYLDLRLGLSAAGKVWFANEGGFVNGVAAGNQLFSYDPATNQLTQTAAKVLTEPAKELYGTIGFATDKRLYIGMGEYGFIDGTPAGPVSGFAQFNL